MILPLILLFAITAPPLSTLPDGFEAHCRSVHDVDVEMRAAPSKDERLIGEVTPDNTQRVDILKRGGQFTVNSGGADAQIIARNSPNFKVVVLKEQLGNVVISVSTEAMGSWTEIYHLRYDNHIGAMTVSRLTYSGTSLDDTSLQDFRCSTSM